MLAFVPGQTQIRDINEDHHAQNYQDRGLNRQVFFVRGTSDAVVLGKKGNRVDGTLGVVVRSVPR